MFCHNCGKEVSDEAAFCTNCGGLLKDNVIQVKAEEQPQKNGMAVAGFVCSFLSPVLGWIFGGIGLSRSNKRNGKGKGLSIAALAIASVNFLLGLIIL